MKYGVKQLSATVFAITLGREKVGQIVRKHDGSGWYGRLQYGKNKLEHTASTASSTAEELVRMANRISLCGKNDHSAAVRALEKQNEREVVRAVAEEILGTPDPIRQAIRDLGIRGVDDLLPRKRLVRRKILI